MTKKTNAVAWKDHACWMLLWLALIVLDLLT